MAEKLTSHAQGLSALEARVLALQGRTNELEREALLASQLLQSLAQQNYQVAQALEALQKRMRVLFWTSGVLAVVALGTLLSLAFH